MRCYYQKEFELHDAIHARVVAMDDGTRYVASARLVCYRVESADERRRMRAATYRLAALACEALPCAASDKVRVGEYEVYVSTPGTTSATSIARALARCCEELAEART